VIRVVCDANTLVSGFVGVRDPDSIPGHVIRAWRDGRFTLVLSQHLLDEVIRTFGQTYFRRKLTPSQISRAAALLRFEAILTAITVDVQGVATHHEDDMVLATAMSANATHLVTGDKKLLQLRSHSGIPIVSLREFAELLRE
jgi:putative PIN family toxin of toxin-antitoxin system